MTSNKYFERFVSILSTIEESGISTADELKLDKNNSLWNELYFATQGFINYYALASKTSKNKKGEIKSGNEDKVKYLIEHGGMELYDIQMDILLHIIKKVDHILAQSPVSKMIFYTYKIVNNKINEMLRKLPPVEVVPLDTTINSDTNENGAVLSELIGDDTYNPERIHVERETVKELKKKLKAKQARELAEEREKILQEVRLISKRPPEVLIFLCSKLGMKSADIADFIIENGAVTSFAKTIISVSYKFDIPLLDLHNCITNRIIDEKDLKLDTSDKRKIVDQVYHLKSRAKKRIEKTEKCDHSKNITE